MDVWMLKLFQGVRFIRFKICGRIDTDERDHKKGAVKPLFSIMSICYISTFVHTISPESPIFSQKIALALSREPTL